MENKDQIMGNHMPVSETVRAYSLILQTHQLGKLCDASLSHPLQIQLDMLFYACCSNMFCCAKWMFFREMKMWLL